MTVKDILKIIGSFLVGKPQLEGWLKDAIFRVVVLISSTVFLMIARIKVMGAQLPVFTRYVEMICL